MYSNNLSPYSSRSYYSYYTIATVSVAIAYILWGPSYNRKLARRGTYNLNYYFILKY